MVCCDVIVKFVYLFVQITQLEKELDSEKKDHAHFMGAFNKVSTMRDELSARNAYLEEQLRVSPIELKSIVEIY